MRSLVGFKSGFAATRGSWRQTLTITGREIRSPDGQSLSTKPENEEKDPFEFPKPYLDKSITQPQSNRQRRMRVWRCLTEWKHDRGSGKDWVDVWNAPAPFDPAKVPLDIRMGAAQNMIPKPSKYGNLELMKVQNFLHLTPPAIKRHCEELKQYCTQWPKELVSDEDCEREFPVEIHTTDYVHAGQSQRNPKARVAALKIRLCNLALDSHARVKLIKLAGERYNPKSDILTTNADRCPVRKQNREYLDYLLTVLFYEAWKFETWETTEYIEDQDGIYWWNDSNSYHSLLRVMKSHPKYSTIFKTLDGGSTEPSKSLEEITDVKAYRDAVCGIKVPDQDITDEGRRSLIFRYKEAVRMLLSLPHL